MGQSKKLWCGFGTGNYHVVMKTILIAVLVSFAVSYFTVQVLYTNAGEHQNSSMALVPTNSQVDAGNARAALIEANQALSARVAFLENQPANEVRLPAAGDWVSKEEFLALQEELRTATQSLAKQSTPSIDLANPQVREQLGTALEEIRASEFADKVEAAQENRAANLEPMLAKLQTRLGLNQAQVTQMRSALESKMTLDADLTRRWEEGEDTEVLGQVKADNRVAHQAELARILTTAQLEQHQGRRTGK
jgi:hypothetical protein